MSSRPNAPTLPVPALTGDSGPRTPAITPLLGTVETLEAALRRVEFAVASLEADRDELRAVRRLTAPHLRAAVAPGLAEEYRVSQARILGALCKDLGRPHLAPLIPVPGRAQPRGEDELTAAVAGLVASLKVEIERALAGAPRPSGDLRRRSHFGALDLSFLDSLSDAR